MGYDVENGFFGEETENAITDSLMAKIAAGESVTKELNAIPLQDRLSIAKKMEGRANAGDTTNQYPDLKLNIQSENGKEHLVDMTVKGEWFGVFNGRSFSNQDVYDMGLKDTMSPTGGYDKNSKFGVDDALNQKIAERQIIIGNLPELELYKALVDEADTSVSRRLGK